MKTVAFLGGTLQRGAWKIDRLPGLWGRRMAAAEEGEAVGVPVLPRGPLAAHTKCDAARLATGYLSRWDPTRAMLGFLLPPVSRRIYRGRTQNALVALHDYNLSTSSIGGLIGSADSFAPFIQSQLNGGSPLLSEETTQRMQTLIAKGRAGIESKIGVGLGWKLGVAGNHRFLNHEGSGAGFTSELRLHPDEGLGMVVLMNKSSMSKTMRVAHEVCEVIRESREMLR